MAAYNDIMTMLLGLSRFHSASLIIANINVSACQAVAINLFKLMCKLDKYENSI